MPKEIIRSNERYAFTVQAEVIWTRDGFVQIATRNFGIDTDPASGDAGWYAELDRGGINRLIRALRKARDQAFGADA